MSLKNEKRNIVIAGLIIGVIASVLVLFGNPVNMGFCIACFVRDIAGGLGLHSAGAVQYIRPEIIGIALGSFAMAVMKKEFNVRGGSAPITRFFLGAFVMVGSLMFLGCPFRMVLRLAGGDFNAILGIVGFAVGIAIGVFFIKRGYSLKRSYKQPKAEGYIYPVVALVLLTLVALAPSFIRFSEAGAGPGALHAAIIISLAAGLIVGALAQRTRLCMVGGIRDVILFRETKLLLGFVAVFVGCLVCNLILTGATEGTFFKTGFEGQAVAHVDGLWNFLGMLLVGFASALLGGCPLRQLVLSGEGSSDSFVTVLGLTVGAAFCHNFGLASSGKGPTPNGQVAVIIGIVFALIIACVNTFRKED
ncbi:MAG: YedE-related selenium metabolism membrane protein [Oscillospiraceae bacterium]|nr:YedE-related selenium metabolism membrane protein [Oscillospiraceae bacterium]